MSAGRIGGAARAARRVEAAGEAPAPAGLTPAAVLAAPGGGAPIEVEIAAGPGPARRAAARIALAAPYRPTPGDRVLVAPAGDDLYVVGLIEAARPPEIPLPDGAAVRVREGAAEIVDPAGRVVARYQGGALEISAPAGDLTLAAPAGRIALRSGHDIDLCAARDVQQRAGRRVDVVAGRGEASTRLRVGAAATALETRKLEVDARSSRLRTDEAAVLAGKIATTAGAIVQQVERLELTATRLVERTRDTYRDASDLAQTRVGRARTVVKELYALYTGRTAMVSEEDTSIDGRRVLLG